MVTEMDIETAARQWCNREAELEIPGNQWGFDVLSAWGAARSANAELRADVRRLRAGVKNAVFMLEGYKRGLVSIWHKRDSAILEKEAWRLRALLDTTADPAGTEKPK